jgi:hypothetical protein
MWEGKMLTRNARPSLTDMGKAADRECHARRHFRGEAAADVPVRSSDRWLSEQGRSGKGSDAEARWQLKSIGPGSEFQKRPRDVATRCGLPFAPDQRHQIAEAPGAGTADR